MQMKTYSIRYFFLLLTITFSPLLRAQHNGHVADSLVFVQTIWHTDTLDGCFCHQYHFTAAQPLFGACQYISFIEIPKKSPVHLQFVSDTILTRVSTFAQRHHAIAGINGSYFNMSTGSPVCFLRIDGITLGENEPSRHDSLHRKYYQNAVLRLSSKGGIRFTFPEEIRTDEHHMRDSNIMTTGPMLLYHGSYVPQRSDRRFVYGRHNRTAIGRRPDGTMLLLVADGRAKGEAAGLSIPELARVMRWLGCSEAANLDGGGSSVMYTCLHDTDTIVNHPSDNGHFDAQGERRVANAILVVR